jgi:hypothetical protein
VENPRLTRRANHGHIDIIAKSYSPSRESAAGFFVGEAQSCKSSFVLPKFVRRIFIKFDTSGKSPAH